MAEDDRARSRRVQRRYDSETRDAVQKAADEFKSEVRDTFREIETRERKMKELLVNRQRTQDEAVRAHIDSLIESHQTAVEDLMKNARSGAASYWDLMSRDERKALMRRIKEMQELEDTTSDAIRRVHGDFDDMLGDMDQSLTDTMGQWSDKLRELADTFNLSAIANALEENVDSYVKNLREMRTATGSWFDEKAFSNSVSNMVKDLSSYNRNEASDFYSEFMRSFSFKDVEEASMFAKELGAATKAFGNAVSDYENIVWRDEDAGQNGRMVRGINNIAAALEDNENLYVSAASVISKINDNINNIYTLSRKDFKRQKSLINSVAAIEAFQESAANDGLSDFSERLTKWATSFEATNIEDESFRMTAAMLGYNIKDFQAAISDPEQLEDVISRLYDVLERVDDTDTGAYRLKKIAEVMGFDSAEAFASILNTDREEAVAAIREAVISTQIADVATDNGDSFAADKEGETVGAIEAMKNEMSLLWGPVADWFGELDVSMANLANLAIVGSTLLDAGGKILDFIGGGGTASAFISKIGGAVGGVLSKIPGVGKLGSWLQGLSGAGGGGAGGAGGGGGAGGPGLLSRIGGMLSGMTQAGGLFEGISASSWGVGAGSTVLSIAAPVAGGFMALNDAIAGAGKAEEWLGAEDADTASGKVASVLGGALGGTSSGVGGALSGAAKGALIGAVAGPVGAAVGGLIGAAAGAIGGEKIAKAIKGTWDFAKDMAGSAWNFAKDTAKKVWDSTRKFAKEAWNTAKTVASDVWKGISKAAGQVWKGLQDGAKAFAEAGATLLEGAGEFAKGVGEGIGAAATGIGVGAGAAAAGFGEGAGFVITGFGDAAKSMFDGWFGGISDVLSGLGDTLSGFGEGLGAVASGFGEGAGSVIDSLTGGKGVIGSLTNGLTDLKNLVFGGGKTEVDLSSVLENATGDPVLDRLDILIAYSKAIAENGGTSGEGSKGIVDELEEEVGDAYNGLKTVVTDVYNGVTKAASDAYNGAKTVASDALNLGKGAWNATLGNLPFLPKFANGISYVPNDGAAFIHEGEAVLTKDQADVVRGEADGGIDPYSNKQLTSLANSFGFGSVRDFETVLSGDASDALNSIKESLGFILENDIETTENDMENEEQLLKEFKKNGIFGKFMNNLKSGSFAKTLVKGLFGSNSKITQTLKKFMGGSGSSGGIFGSFAKALGLGGSSSGSGGGSYGGSYGGGSYGGSSGSGSGGGSTFSGGGSSLAEFVSNMTSSHEGNYGSINYNDNGAVSIGKMQWHAGNAKNLLNMIREADQEGFNSIISQYGAQDLANSLASGDNWGSHVVEKGSAEAQAIKALLETTIGQNIQEQQRVAWAQGYIDKGQKLGLTDQKALAFLADMYNQYGMYNNTINNKIIPQAIANGGTLDAIYNATLNNFSQYHTRRQSIYDTLKDANFFGLSANDTGSGGAVAEVPHTSDWIQIAMSQKGYKEGTNNDTPFGTWIGSPNQPWCAAFVSWALAQAGVSGLKSASTGTLMSQAQQMGVYRDKSSYIPGYGDVFFEKSNGAGHTGFVISSDSSGTFKTIEGNASDMVKSVTRHTSDRTMTGFAALGNKGSMDTTALDTSSPEGMSTYAVGTPWVPEDQVAFIHEGEAIVPAESNPLNRPTPYVDLPESAGNDDVVEALQWTVSRLEAKLDRLIDAVSSSKRTVRRAEEIQRVFAPVKT